MNPVHAEITSRLTEGSHWIGYHDNCPDGFSAAYLLTEMLERIGAEPPTLQPLNHGETVDHPNQNHVWLVDFANVPIDWIVEHAKEGTHRSFIVLDHHQTACSMMATLHDEWEEHFGEPGTCLSTATEWSDRLSFESHIMVIDQNRSGVGLAAAYAASLGLDTYDLFWPWPEIQDRDLWRYALPNTEEISCVVSSHPYTFEAYDEIQKASPAWLFNEGAAICRYRDQLVESCCQSTFNLPIPAVGVSEPILAANAPYMVGSDVAGKLALISPSKVGAYVIYHADHVQVGLRSTPDGPDVAEIAQQYGGGGHKHAAGLRLSFDIFDGVYEAF